MSPIEKYKKLIVLVAEKRRIENWAKRRGNEFYFTFDEKAKIRGINAKIDRLLDNQPKEPIPQTIFKNAE